MSACLSCVAEINKPPQCLSTTHHSLQLHLQTPLLCFQSHDIILLLLPLYLELSSPPPLPLLLPLTLKLPLCSLERMRTVTLKCKETTLCCDNKGGNIHTLSTVIQRAITCSLTSFLSISLCRSSSLCLSSSLCRSSLLSSSFLLLSSASRASLSFLSCSSLAF